MELKQKNTFIKGALFLTLAGFISKVLSAAYRIPLQNLTGDHGFYIYQQVYPFLGMIIILSLYGLPSAIAKIIADFERTKKGVTFRTVFGPIFILLFFSFSFLAAVLFFSAEKLASLLGDPKLAVSYRWVSIALLVVPFTALFRGIFQGFGRVDVIAYSQIGEQLIRVAIIIISAVLIAKGFFNVYSIGTFGVFASIAGAIMAIIILLIFIKTSHVTIDGEIQVAWLDYGKTLLLFGLFASLNHMILLLTQFADVFTLVPHLVKSGFTPIKAMELKGVFDRGMPLIQLGTVVGSSFALALVPTVVRENLSSSRSTIESSLKISFLVSAGAVIGLILIFEETNVLLYKNASGTFTLQVLSLSILLTTMSITAVSVLQSLGYFKRTGIYIICTFIVKWILNVLLIPHLGILGSSLATVGSLLFLLVASLWELRRRIAGFRFLQTSLIKPFCIAAASMVLFLLLVKGLLPYENLTSRSSLFFYVVFVVLGGAGIYMFFLLRLGLFSREEIETFPFASLLGRIYKGRD